MATGADIVTYARDQIGKPYVFGAAGPNTFDCSGLVQYVYKHFGLAVPRTTFQMADDPSLVPVQKTDLQAGDLIFSHWDQEGPNSHMGIYTGKGTIIEAPQPGQNVMETTLGPSYWSHVDTLRRVPGLSGSSAASSASGATLSSWWDPLVNAGTAAGQSVAGVATGALDIVGALENVGGELHSMAGAMLTDSALAGQLLKLFLPSNLMRAALMFAGIIFVLIGIRFLASEVNDQ